MQMDVECFLGPGQDLYHLALLHQGLVELEDQGRIRLRWIRARGAQQQLSNDCHTFLHLRHNGREVRVGVDLYDKGSRIEAELLREVDVYFKRSYSAGIAAKQGMAKVRPLGLNFAASGPGTKWKIWWQGGAGLWQRAMKNRGKLRQFLETPAIGIFERPPAIAAEAKVIFQPRLWEPGSSDDDLENVNRLRVDLVRVFRQEFGGRFVGGLVPTAYARLHYPELLSPAPVRRELYVKESLRSAIGVNTRGLHGSNPFKLGEYLAGSFAILSDPLLYELPEPMRNGEEYLEYRSAEDCARHIAELFRRPEAIDALRDAAWRYYCSNLQPAALWEKRLAAAFSTGAQN
ncbi:MAG: hypothetical protein OHK0021_22180 [Bryobacter sp.]